MVSEIWKSSKRQSTTSEVSFCSGENAGVTGWRNKVNNRIGGKIELWLLSGEHLRSFMKS